MPLAESSSIHRDPVEPTTRAAIEGVPHDAADDCSTRSTPEHVVNRMLNESSAASPRSATLTSAALTPPIGPNHALT